MRIFPRRTAASILFPSFAISASEKGHLYLARTNFECAAARGIASSTAASTRDRVLDCHNMDAFGANYYGALFLDPMFNQVFSIPANAQPLIDACLRLRSASVTDVEERVVAEASFVCEVRRVVLDAFCVLDGREEVVVEMQNIVHTNFVKRMAG
jgi:hypothetical protein